MWEIRSVRLDYRTFYFFASRVMWILEVCKKEDQKAGAKRALKRMADIQQRLKEAK